MVVAVAILGVSLGALYSAAGGATRSVAVDEKMAYAVELARSLVANYAVVPPEGLSEAGETNGGFTWQVEATPLAVAEESPLEEGVLQHLRVAVSWPDGERDRSFSLESVVAGTAGEQ
jgi:general secretion pathway protein I